MPGVIVSCGERWEDRERKFDENGVVELIRTWVVTVAQDEDGLWPPLADVTTANGVILYQSHPDEIRCIARSVVTKTFGTPEAFLVTVTYSDGPFRGDGGFPSEQDPSHPTKKSNNNSTTATDRPPVVKMSRKETKVAPVVDRDGDAVVNAAGDAFEGLEIDKPILQITITYYSVKITFAHIVKYWNACNADTWNDISEGLLKVIDFQYEWVYENIGGATALLYHCTIVLEHNPDGWGTTVMNAGRREIPTGGTGGARWITDEAGQPVSDPVPLTTSGQRLAAGGAPNYKTFYFCKEWPFTTIQANTTVVPPIVYQEGLLI